MQIQSRNSIHSPTQCPLCRNRLGRVGLFTCGACRLSLHAVCAREFNLANCPTAGCESPLAGVTRRPRLTVSSRATDQEIAEDGTVVVIMFGAISFAFFLMFTLSQLTAFLLAGIGFMGAGAVTFAVAIPSESHVTVAPLTPPTPRRAEQSDPQPDASPAPSATNVGWATIEQAIDGARLY